MRLDDVMARMKSRPRTLNVDTLFHIRQSSFQQKQQTQWYFIVTIVSCSFILLAVLCFSLRARIYIISFWDVFLNPWFHQPTRLYEKTAPLPLLIPGKSYMTYKETTLKETSPLPCIKRSKQPNVSPASRNRQYELNSANLETLTLQFPVKAAVDRTWHFADDLHPDMKLNATVPSSATRPLCKHYLRKPIVS